MYGVARGTLETLEKKFDFFSHVTTEVLKGSLKKFCQFCPNVWPAMAKYTNVQNLLR